MRFVRAEQLCDRQHTGRPVGRSVGRSVSRSVVESAGRPVGRSGGLVGRGWVGRSVAELVGR